METQKNYTLDWERFGEGTDQYLIKLNIARNDRHYLKITRRNHDTSSPYHGTGVILFEEDFSFLIEALSMIMTRYVHGEGRAA